MTRARSKPDQDLPVLTIPRSKFEAELVERIELGEEIAERKVQSSEELAAARSDYYTGDDYNREFLRRRFSTAEIADEYSAFYGGTVGPRTFGEDIEEFRDDVRSSLRRLDSVKKRIPLFEESVHVQAPREPKGPREDAEIESIFIVHGHHEALKLAVHGLLRKIVNVKPVILHDQANRGRTLLEKFEAVGTEAGYAIVLLTADDFGRASSVDPSEEQARARQNVVWEFGFFAGALGRNRVAILYEEGVERPL